MNDRKIPAHVPWLSCIRWHPDSCSLSGPAPLLKSKGEVPDAGRGHLQTCHSDLTECYHLQRRLLHATAASGGYLPRYHF